MDQKTTFLSEQKNTFITLITAILIITSLMVLILWIDNQYFIPPQLEVDYIDVSHGDSFLLKTSEGKTVLIDGGYPHSGALDYLKKHQINHLDLIIVSHPHDDHAGGLAEILRSIPIDLLIDNGQKIDSPDYLDFMKAEKESGVKTLVVKEGDKIPFGKLFFKVISPPSINPKNININSLVLRLDVGKVSFLFTGDTEKDAEFRMVHSKEPLHVDFFKVPHHGGVTSSSLGFLQAVKPTYAIISTEVDEIGYPSQYPLKNIFSVGAKIYQTSFNGTITVLTNGTTYTILTERGGPITSMDTYRGHVKEIDASEEEKP